MPRNYAVETVSSLPFGMLIGAPLSAAIEAQTQAAKATIDFILQVGFLPPAAMVPQGQELDDQTPVEVTRPDVVPAPTANPSTDAGRTRMVTFSYATSNADPAVVAVAERAAAAALAKGNAAVAAAGQNPPAKTGVAEATAAVAAEPGVTPAMTAAADAAAAVVAPVPTPASVAAAIVASTNQTATITVPLLSVVPIPFFSIDEMTIDFVAKITEAITASSKAASQSVKSASTQARGGWGPVSGGLKAGLSSTHSSTSERSSKYQTELTMSIHVRASSESMPKGMAKVLDMLAGLIKSERA